MKDKFKPKWVCKICNTHFQKKEPHGCLNKDNKEDWISFQQYQKETS